MDTYENDNLDIKPVEDTAASDVTEYAADEAVPAASEIVDVPVQEPVADVPQQVLEAPAEECPFAEAALPHLQ